MASIFLKLFSRSDVKAETSDALLVPFEYERMIHLDAENLAEQGMADAYRQVLPELGKFVKQPAELSETLDPDIPTYLVRCDGQEYLIYSAHEPSTEDLSWGRATYFFFQIVNQQLAGADVRFYAINQGNDLAGLFLTPEQATSARSVLPRKSDWPYIPELSDPWYGQFH